MPLQGYGVLKSQPVKYMVGRNTAHFEIHTVDEENDYRIAVNVKSQTSPPELRYIILEDFRHEITNGLEVLEKGFIPLVSEPGGIAVDYIRGNLFDYHKMKIAKHIDGKENELLDTIEKYIDRAIRTKDALIYSFGQKWGPENKRDEYFGYRPGGGIHDIHMNQGNSGRWMSDNGVWQDGGMLIHFPSEDRWVAIFLAFQSQEFHTNDSTGNPIENRSVWNENTVVIVSALLNPISGMPAISLLNTTSNDIDLSGWALADRMKEKKKLKGVIKAGDFITINIILPELILPESGGIISLLDENGIKINGVSYTAKEYSEKGITTKF
jgi:uncharacterized protein YukJ